MELLAARNLTIERNGATLVQQAELTLRTGERLGLVGANGSGKSTLLQVLAGRLPPLEGTIRRAPGIRVGYLAQDPEWPGSVTAWEAALGGLEYNRELEGELRAEERRLASGHGCMARYSELDALFDRAGGYRAEASLRESLATLGLSEAKLSLLVSELSGGERARLALARALAGDPELLLMDEPSNHLDLPAIRWLSERLTRWQGAVVLVSHDRALLDDVCTDTAELRTAALTRFRGGISRLREQQGVRARSSERRARERRKEAERLDRTIGELRAWGTPKAQRHRRRLERQRAEGEGPEAHAGASPTRLDLKAREANGVLMRVRGLRKAIAGRTVVAGAALQLLSGEKVALLGPNGSGKSTLLRLLAGEWSSDDPEVRFWWHRDAKPLYADQQLRGLVPDVPLLEQLHGLVRAERAHQLLALCGITDNVRVLAPESMSPGERARAGLARLLAAEANLLLLDEPTNDLDLSAIETLHHALSATTATVVFATHDRALAGLADRVLALEDGELVEYRGGLTGYLAGRRRIESNLPAWEGEPGQGGARERVPRHERAELEGQVPDRLGYEHLELEELELERSGVEARLEDPLSLGDRERQRLERRLVELYDELSQRYDRSLPPPGPRFSVSEGGERIGADIAGGGLHFECKAPVAMTLMLHDNVGHLQLREFEGNLLLPWARSVLVDGAVRLAFYALRPRAVQLHYRAALDSRYLTAGPDGWWWTTLERFEEIEGWTQRVGRAAARGAPARVV